DGELYLEPEASFAAVQRFARDQNESFAVTASTLRRRLKEKGLLASTDAARGKLTVRRTLQGERRDVLHIAREGAPSGPHSSPAGPGGEDGAADGPKPRAGSWAGNGQANGEAARENPVVVQGNGPVGPMGRSVGGGEATAGELPPEQQAE